MKIIESLDNIISREMIDWSKELGACPHSLKWLRENPRSCNDLKEYSLDWFSWAIMEYPHISPLVVRTLARDPHSWIRQAIMHRENVPLDLIRNATTDKDEAVRFIVAHRKDLPFDLLSRLVNDTNCYVAYEASCHMHAYLRANRDILKELVP